MNISEAKQIPVSLLAERLGAEFVRRTKPWEVWYKSPLRQETTGSFKIDERDNSWKDFGHTRPKGSVIDLWIDYHNRDRKDKEAIKDALKALEDFGGIQQKFIENVEQVTTYSERYRIKKWSPRIKAQGMVEHLTYRGLPRKHVNRHISEVLVEDTERKYNGKPVLFNAFAMENDLGGVEICAYYPKKEKPFNKFKNCIGPKGITTYPAEAHEKEITAFAFSSKWDALTWLAMKPQEPDEEIIIYHGDSLVNPAAEHILKNERIKKVLHFKHLDPSGERADAELARKLEAAPILYATMERTYTGYKDLSEWKIANPSGAAFKFEKQWHEQLIVQPGKPKV